MDKKKESKSNHFLWGVFIGAGLAYLVGTEKGRGLLKELMQEGADFISDVTTPEAEENPAVYNEEAIEVDSEENNEVTPEEEKPQTPKKRFFKAKR